AFRPLGRALSYFGLRLTSPGWRHTSIAEASSGTGASSSPSMPTSERLLRCRQLHSVVPAGRFRRDISVTDVAVQGLAIAFRRRTVATTPAGHDADDLPGRDGVLGGFAHVSHGAVGRGDLHAVDGTVLPAPEPPGRRRLALEAEGDEGRQQEVVVALDAEAPAVASGATRVLAQPVAGDANQRKRSEEHTSELQSRGHLVCRLLLEKKKQEEQRD